MAETHRKRRRRGTTVARPGRDRSYQRQLTNPFTPLRVLSDEAVEMIHESTLRLLSGDGIKVLLPEARNYFAGAGGVIDEESLMVTLDPEAVVAAVDLAPSEHNLHTRNPERLVRMGGDSVAFVLVGGPPHAHDIDRGKRDGTIEDYRNFMRLGQHFDVLHMMSPAVEPMNVPMNERHLQVIHAQLTETDKVPFIYARGRGQVTDGLEMIRIANGVSESEFQQKPYVYTVVNTNSPRQLDIPMCMGMIQFAEANQPTVITPFTLAGAMAPVALAGALTLQHAEALAGIMLTQLVRPGAPVVYGAFTSNVDMRSGAPAFGTPEAVQGGNRQRPTRPSSRTPMAFIRRQHIERRRRSGRLRDDLEHHGRAHGRCQHDHPRNRLDGIGADNLIREIHPRCGDVPDLGGVVPAARGE